MFAYTNIIALLPPPTRFLVVEILYFSDLSVPKKEKAFYKKTARISHSPETRAVNVIFKINYSSSAFLSRIALQAAQAGQSL